MIKARRPGAGTAKAGALALTLVLALSGALAGCANSVDPIERLGRKATEGVQDGRSGRPGHPAATATPTPSPGGSAGAAVSTAYRRWGLARPLRFAPRPARKAQLPPAEPGRIPVVDRIPVPAGQKTVFLTYDDGAEKDPAFLRMVADLKLPISMFLTDGVASSDYGHFAEIKKLGPGSEINNHTLTHPNLRTLPYERQRAEICGQQERLEKRFGAAPRLFRPPYGNYNDATLRAAADCGLEKLVLWRVSMQIHDFQYAEGDALRPGDIVLAHFRGPSELKGTTITQMTARMLRRIQDQGYAIGRLEDYL
ncbi:polysaccharide deacetylase family protein [Streptomyces sp. NPDC093225]|uniref:polysaccharide deacetylase family protein n=1 Tax=Streptomyces sp. NPDC093225 TaxID=3366034 RepID=UPI00382624CF